jgi:outer membrane receptor protein involved in Fe transport
MTFLQTVRASCLAGLALGATALAAHPAPAMAQAVADYDVPAGDLGQTLKSIARISGRDILFRPEAVRGRTAPAVKGRLSLNEALREALAGSGLTIGYRAGAALVLDPAAAEPAGAPASQERTSITVTGTRIRGAGSASPVTITTRRDLEQRGISDLAGFARVLPQNFTGGQNPGVAGGGEQGGQDNINNSTALNLRGLGPDATLTLINGHRTAYDALDQGIDISAIPLDAVERIEVVTDGSSALYGSDAVGGVANIILRRDYDGLEASARAGAATEGGDIEQQYDMVGGSRWPSGGFMLALDHSRSTPIYANQRPYTRNLDPSLTLTMRNAQTSAVLALHQQLAPGLTLELDGYAMDRRSSKQSPFLPDADVHVFGLTTKPTLRSYAVTPTLRADLPSGWQAALSATSAVSRTLIATAQWSNFSAFRSRLLYQNSLSGVEATGEGPLLALPGGDARLALGGGVRRVALHVNVSDFVGSGLVPFQVFTERRLVQFAYGELSLPLVGPVQHLPMLERLTFSAALRYERWKGIDRDATPKLGLVYEPSGDATIRATWGKSFKVPTLDQVHQVLQGVLFPAYFFSPQPNPPLAAGSTVLLLGGGNPNLHSEHATSWSATLEVHPRRVEGLNLRATYFDVDFRDRIASPMTDVLSALPNPLYRDLITFNPTADQVNALIATLPQGLSNQTGAPFDPSSVAAIIDDAPRNTARERVHGVDFGGDYRLALAPQNSLLLSAEGSWLDSNLQLTASQPVIPRAGTIFNPPHWRGRASALWEWGRAGLSASLNYLGSLADTRFPDAPRIGPFVTLDVSAALRTRPGAGAFRNIELRLSALNLLDEKPAIIRNSQPEAPSYDSTNQSPVGRVISLSLRKVW